MVQKIEGREPDQVFEASELYWKPGHWPKNCRFGNICNAVRGFDGDMMFVDYEDLKNEIITRVFND